MVGLLKAANGGFCVEYEDRNVQVFWSPGAQEAWARAQKWITEALPGLEKIPESMLRDLIGARADFNPHPRHEEKTVEWQGKLSDGGSVRFVYFKLERLGDGDRRDAAEKFAVWQRSWLP